jgi:hypothetical protein
VNGAYGSRTARVSAETLAKSRFSDPPTCMRRRLEILGKRDTNGRRMYHRMYPHRLRHLPPIPTSSAWSPPGRAYPTRSGVRCWPCSVPYPGAAGKGRVATPTRPLHGSRAPEAVPGREAVGLAGVTSREPPR